jgi:hypothetical protein
MGSATYFGASHLSFKKMRLKMGAKLHEYEVRNQREKIGIIHWRGGWRQYVFQAEPEIDMSRSCQKEIINFIDKRMKEFRER